jgi:hypothetical protein
MKPYIYPICNAVLPNVDHLYITIPKTHIPTTLLGWQDYKLPFRMNNVWPSSTSHWRIHDRERYIWLAWLMSRCCGYCKYATYTTREYKLSLFVINLRFIVVAQHWTFTHQYHSRFHGPPHSQVIVIENNKLTISTCNSTIQINCNRLIKWAIGINEQE